LKAVVAGVVAVAIVGEGVSKGETEEEEVAEGRRPFLVS
jgi:hypothetical protein